MKSPFIDIPFIKNPEPDSFLLIAGPCVVESEATVLKTAEKLVAIVTPLKIPYIFKASYRKANRSRSGSFIGIGDRMALNIISKVRKEFSIPVTTDVHTPAEAAIAAEFVDVIQIPAFLCRQTELLTAAAATGKWINIKKGQFMSGAGMIFAIEKVKDAGNKNIILTERGNSFGYNDLVVDFRNIPVMKKTGVPVIVDITHSLQQPNQPAGITGGVPEMAETIGLAAIAVGADGIFIETHPDPETAKCDSLNMVRLDCIEKLLNKFVRIRKTVASFNI